jgi:hypothetical protein
MAEKTVRVYDPVTNTVSTRPASELPPNLTKIHIADQGEIWVDTSKIKQEQSRVPGAPLPEAARQALGGLRDNFEEVYPRTLEEWEDALRANPHAEHELALWLFMQDMYLHFTTGWTLDPDQPADICRHIFQVVTGYMTQGTVKVLAMTHAPALSENRVREMVTFMQNAAREGMPRARAKAAALLAPAAAKP